jgi:hypothetical protein
MSDKKIESYKIIGLPDGAVLWPTAFASIVLGTLDLILNPETGVFTTVFLIVFAINLLILFFDFARGAVLGIFGLLVAVLALAKTYNLNLPITSLLAQGTVVANGAFLIVFGIVFILLLIFSYMFRQGFEYYIIKSNSIFKKHGIFGNAKRYSTQNIELSKEINDVLDSIILFNGGDLRIRTNREEFVIHNVPRINKAENAIRKLLSSYEVDVK